MLWITQKEYILISIVVHGSKQKQIKKKKELGWMTQEGPLIDTKYNYWD